jgi:hypothetical protein
MVGCKGLNMAHGVLKDKSTSSMLDDLEEFFDMGVEKPPDSMDSLERSIQFFYKDCLNKAPLSGESGSGDLTSIPLPHPYQDIIVTNGPTTGKDEDNHRLYQPPPKNQQTILHGWTEAKPTSGNSDTYGAKKAAWPKPRKVNFDDGISRQSELNNVNLPNGTSRETRSPIPLHTSFVPEDDETRTLLAQAKKSSESNLDAFKDAFKKATSTVSPERRQNNPSLQHEGTTAATASQRVVLLSEEVLPDNDERSMSERKERPSRSPKKQPEKWTMRLEEVKHFVKEHGHCKIPTVYPPNQVLARWAKRQRYQRTLFTSRVAGNRASCMTLERIDALNELGFIWDNHENGWNVRYKELLEFIKKEGHTSVPTDYRQNLPLATWVRMQRRQYKLWKEKNKYSMMTS